MSYCADWGWNIKKLKLFAGVSDIHIYYVPVVHAFSKNPNPPIQLGKYLNMSDKS